MCDPGAYYAGLEAEAIERMNAWINAKRTAYDQHGQPIDKD